MRNFRAGKLAARSVVAMLVAFGLLLSALPTKAGANGGTFPIGIFFPPGAQATTQAKYAEIAGMNANFIVGAGVLVTPEANGPALDMAQANGLKLLASDFRLHWRDEHLAQSANGAGLWVSSGNSLGQTFKSPAAGTQWYITGVKLNIDIGNWPAGVKLTLSIYDSPAKGTLLGSSSITGPASTYFPSFSLSKPVATNTSYYMELTSDSTTAIGWVATSTGDAYGNGTAYQQGAALGRDLWFDVSFAQLAYNDGHRPSDSDIDAIVGQYGAHPALLGYHLYDEPSADLMSRLQSVQRRIEQQQPGAFTFLNLLPIYATPAQWNVGSVSGDFARPNRVLGQTFRTAPGQNVISTLQLWIDHLTWGAGEALTLKLWNSPAKQSLIAQSTLTSSTTDWPVFTLNAAVAPSTDYYWELTHNGGGDSSVGWVIQSNSGDNWVNDGTAYVNGQSIDADFWFVLNQAIQGGTYEDYVYRWASKQPDVLAFDHYPFMSDGSFKSDYYANLEIVRRQARYAGIDFWSYIQSVGITNYMKQPTLEEMRYQIYTNLAYGAKGYIYFTYTTPGPEASGEPFYGGLILPDGSRNVSYDYAKTINAEVERLGSVLSGLSSQEVYHTGTLPSGARSLPASFFWQLEDAGQPAVIGYFKDAANRKYIMVVNRDYANARTLSFSLPSKPSAVTEWSKTTGAEIATNYNAATGKLSASFAPGEGRLFALPAGY